MTSQIPPTPPDSALRPLAVGADEASRLLSIGRRLLWSLSVSSQIPSVRIGRRRVYRVVDLDRWLADRAKKDQSR